MGILAIDFGLARLGFAYSEGELAEPVATITAKTRAKRLEAVVRTLTQHHVDQIVIGQTAGTLLPVLNAFVADVKKTSGLPVSLIEESMTSVEAKNRLIELQTSAKKRAKNIDAYAAVLILETYLSEYKSTA